MNNEMDEYEYGSSFYLMNIKVNTGYTLEELIREGVMDGQVKDHSQYGHCGCVDVLEEGLHFKCACSHPIRWAYPVNMRGETFYFGSTCIKHWMIRCPDCKNVNSFDKHIVNTIDQWYRCECCHEEFLRKRREKQKKERRKKKKEEEERAIKERDDLVVRIEREQDEHMKMVVKMNRLKQRLLELETQVLILSLRRTCQVCNTLSIKIDAPDYFTKCIQCFKMKPNS